jgi:hypothetical protein
MSVLDDVVKHFVKDKKLKPKDSSVAIGWVDRQRVFFLRRRAHLMMTVHVPQWATAPGDLQKRLGSEFMALEAFLATRIGTLKAPGRLLPVLGGNASLDKIPATLDLADLAHRRTAENRTGTPVKTRARQMSVGRWVKIHGIVWRAAALVPEIWTDVPAANRLTAALADGVLDELVDRRLRTVERMQYQVSDTIPEDDSDPLGAGGLGARRSMFAWGSNVRGPWRDGFRIRLFEYPRLTASTAALQQRVDPSKAGYIADPFTTNFLDHQHDAPTDVGKTPASDHRHWAFHNGRKTRLAWRVVHGTTDLTKQAAEWRFPSALHDDYHAYQSNQYIVEVRPTTGSGSAALDRLFDHGRPGTTAGTAAVTDMWERSWLWCDHVIAAIHLDALLFGLRRRFGAAAGEAKFNDLVAGQNLPPNGAKPYVVLAGLFAAIETIADPILFTHSESRHFKAGIASVNTLQIGDHVIFWNHVLYNVFTTGGDWQLENSFIVSLDLDPVTTETKLSSIRLQGHGTPVRQYGGFQRLIAEKMEGGLADAQQEVRRKVAGVPAATTALPFRGTQLVQWTPYSPLTRVSFGGSRVDLAPWWIVIDPSVTKIPKGGMSDDDYARAVSAVLPKTFAKSAAPAPGYKVPPITKMIYFPLFEPRFAVTVKAAAGAKRKKLSGWAAYFAWHEARATLEKPPAGMVNLMDPLVLSGELIPGLFLRSDNAIPVVQAKPST